MWIVEIEDGRREVDVEIMDLPEIGPGNSSDASFSIHILITALIIIACSSALLSYVLIALQYWCSNSAERLAWHNIYEKIASNFDEIGRSRVYLRSHLRYY